VTAPDRLELPIRDVLVERFCGAGGRAAHATFRGRLEIAFASVHPGAPPLVGVRRDVVLDVIPSSTYASVLDTRATEGARVLAFLGIVPGPSTPRGAPVEQVASASIAERAGIRVGDVIVAADGVHVLSLADIVPVSSRSIELVVRPSDTGVEEPKTLPLVGYAGDRVPREYEPALVMLALGIALFAFLLLPGPDRLVKLEARLATRVRRQPRVDVIGRGRAAAASILGAALVTAFGVLPYVVHPDVDGIVLLVVSLALVVRLRIHGRFVSALAAAMRALPLALVAVLAVFAVLAERGTLAFVEVVRGQGVYPWQWTATRHPGGLVLAAAFVGALVSLGRTKPISRAGLLGASVAFATIFLGGAQAGSAHPLVGASLLLLKTWGVLVGLRVAGTWLPALETRALPGLALRRAVPALVGGALLLASARCWSPSTATEAAFGVSVVATLLLFAIRLATRVRAAASRPEPHASPFL